MRDDGDRAADRKAEGRRASAITRRMGAENKSRDMNMVIKKNRVLIHLGITGAAFFSDLSSLVNPISGEVVPSNEERERENKGGREGR